MSVFCIIIAIVQNVGSRGVYSLGSMSVPVPSTIMVFVVKIIGILFWTWILNLMCKDGHKEIAWFLVLLPFVLLFFMMGTAEGFTDSPICSQGKCATILKEAATCGSSECKNGGSICPLAEKCQSLDKDAEECNKCSNN